MKKIISALAILLSTASCYSMEEDLVLQPLLKNKSKAEMRRMEKKWSPLVNKLPDDLAGIHMVYHPKCNVSFFGLEKKHPFDSSKYEKVYAYLKERHPELKFHKQSGPVSDEALLTVHTDDYIHSLRLTGWSIFSPAKIKRARKLMVEISEMTDLEGVKTFAGHCLLKSKLLKPMRLAVQGTIDAMILALHNGWSINLAGGFHHARSEMGSGYCFYADVPIAIELLHKIRPEFKVLIIDLDVHHGDGNASICGDDDKVFILDMFNKNIFADNQETKKHVNYMADIEPGKLDAEQHDCQEGWKPGGIKDDEYLEELEKLYTQALEEVKPDFIFYNAGTDLYREDPLGRMNITKDGIKQRDWLVFEKALKNNIPICMVPSGGYAKKDFPQTADNSFFAHTIETSSSEIICESLTNILGKINQAKGKKGKGLFSSNSNKVRRRNK